jgi:hypothetical protein
LIEWQVLLTDDRETSTHNNLGPARFSLRLSAMRTMLRLTARQRLMLAEKVLDTANLALAGLVFGQFVGNQTFSYEVALGGVIAWFALVGIGLALSKRG